MAFLKKTALPILLATVWIGLSEFARNEFLLKHHWVNHYEKLGMTFPSDPVNGALWGFWSLVFAVSIFVISTRFSFFQATVLSWIVGFVLMWIVIGNMGVLPFGILPWAVPLSLIEVLVAVLIVAKTSRRSPA